MAKVNKFEDLDVWKEAQAFSSEVYTSLKNNKDYGFRDQIFRASVSVSNNIAEGFERRGNKEFTKFLYIAKGSCGEVRSMLYLARNFSYINKGTFEELYTMSVSISKMLSGLIKSLPKE